MMLATAPGAMAICGAKMEPAMALGAIKEPAMALGAMALGAKETEKTAGMITRARTTDPKYPSVRASNADSAPISAISACLNPDCVPWLILLFF